MEIAIERKIITEYLPDKWAEAAAEKFGCSVNKIERIAYGVSKITVKNSEIFEYLLDLAEKGKKDAAAKQIEFDSRLKALAE